MASRINEMMNANPPYNKVSLVMRAKSIVCGALTIWEVLIHVQDQIVQAVNKDIKTLPASGFFFSETEYKNSKKVQPKLIGPNRSVEAVKSR